MALVYILYSETIDRFYIGYTRNLESRLRQHLTSPNKTRFTAQANDWEVYFLIPELDYWEAIQIEKYIKRMRNRAFMERLKRNPKIIEKIRKKFKPR